LVDDASVSLEDFEHSETTLLSAESALEEVNQELAAALAEVVNTSIDTHPLVEQKKSSLRHAFLQLHRCTVRAPASGIITLRRAQVGQWVNPSDPLMALVPLDQIWVDANFREVSLQNFRIGQHVKLHADIYGRKVIFHGWVVGLNPGTGSVFSVLPPQNATGNWIKIVQRVPVKISLCPEELCMHPLILGLSMTATVDTHDRTGLRLPQPKSTSKHLPTYTTDVYEDELCGVDALIESIIENNISNND
jgi:membrane fusion protein (multidrug efflux system)